MRGGYRRGVSVSESPARFEGYNKERRKSAARGWTLTAVDPDEEARNTLITILLQYVFKRMQQVAS